MLIPVHHPLVWDVSRSLTMPFYPRLTPALCSRLVTVNLFIFHPLLRYQSGTLATQPSSFESMIHAPLSQNLPQRFRFTRSFHEFLTRSAIPERSNRSTDCPAATAALSCKQRAHAQSFPICEATILRLFSSVR